MPEPEIEGPTLDELEPVLAAASTATLPTSTALGWARRIGRVFRNPDERRLRALWRLLLHGLALFVAMFVAGLLIVAALSTLGRLGPPGSSRLVGFSQLSESRLAFFALLQGGLATAVTWLARRVLDRRPLGSLGLQQHGFVVRDLVFGVVLAGLMIATVFVVLLACGWLRIERLAWEASSPGTMLASLGSLGLAFVCVGWYEELISRGYWLVNLRDGIGVRTAVVVSSSIFALGHVANPNATLVSSTALVGAGLFLAWPVLRTGQLWMSIGLHIGWNFFEGPVFGFAVSGMQTFTLVQHEVTGPPLLTGGAFGPEAGLLLLAVEGLGAVAVWFVTRGRVRSVCLQTDQADPS